MVFFLPVIVIAGAAGLSLLASGCGGRPTPPRAPAKGGGTPPPLPPGFPKSALETTGADGSAVDGYQALLTALERSALGSPTRPLSLDALLKGKDPEVKLASLFKDSRQVQKAEAFLEHLATHDEKPDDVSLYDIYFETKHLYGDEWGEDWQAKLLGKGFQAPLQRRVRALGAPLLAPSSPATLTTPARDLLQSLADYAKLAPPSRPEAALVAGLDFYLSTQEPKVFTDYLKGSYADFVGMDGAAQSELFRKAVDAAFPDYDTADKLLRYLSRDEGMRFIRECLRKDPAAALKLFEGLSLPPWEADPDAVSGESEFFPNLPQDLSYAKRQKKIDAFLGEPELTLKRKYTGADGKKIRTTVQKYRWVGDTEVFSVESEKPGPTTLVFAPHYHEQNPRKVFHWMKDLPLKSGRVIFIPEANRAMGRADGATVPMNSLFNKAFTDDRVDYLVVRRTEYLMGLVDGMIGLHDWSRHQPFFISDLVLDAEGKSAGPVASPWLPKKVTEVAKFSHDAELESDSRSKTEADASLLDEKPQAQWQVADYAATKLAALSGGSFAFTLTPLDPKARRIDQATAYMNYFLKKPAMTFEGTAEEEQGQLLARATYAMLLGFGHSIDAKFEKNLEDPDPKREPKLYEGVPTRGSVAK